VPEYQYPLDSAPECPAGPGAYGPAPPLDAGRSLEFAKPLARALNVASIVIGVWGTIYPRPYALVITLLALLPWMAMALGLGFPSLLRLAGNKSERTPNVALSLVFPALILAVRGADHQLLSFAQGAWLALPGAIAFCLPAILIDASARRKGLAVVLILFAAAGYGYGSGTHANALMDRSPARQYFVRVTEKHVFYGRRHRSYRFWLEPWGPQQTPSLVNVSYSLYHQTAVGDNVCVTLRSGAFNVPWYFVRGCNSPR